MRVLICEDEPDMAEVLREFLVSHGYEVATSASGPECLRQCSDCDPDLVLLDIMLPGKDGWEVLQEIRKRSDRPVILVTALGRVDDKVKGLSQGADDYVQKPFSLEELKARYPDFDQGLKGKGLVKPLNQMVYHLYVNTRSVKLRDAGATPLRDGDRIRIFLPVAGG